MQRKHIQTWIASGPLTTDNRLAPATSQAHHLNLTGCQPAMSIILPAEAPP